MDDLRRFTCAVRSIHRLWSSSVSDSLLERIFFGHDAKMAYAGSDRLAEMPGIPITSSYRRFRHNSSNPSILARYSCHIFHNQSTHELCMSCLTRGAACYYYYRNNEQPSNH